MDPEYVANIGLGTDPAKEPTFNINPCPLFPHPRYLGVSVRMIAYEPLNHAGKYTVRNTQCAVYVDGAYILHVLFWGVYKIDWHSVRAADVVH